MLSCFQPAIPITQNIWLKKIVNNNIVYFFIILTIPPTYSKQKHDIYLHLPYIFHCHLLCMYLCIFKSIYRYNFRIFAYLLKSTIEVSYFHHNFSHFIVYFSMLSYFARICTYSVSFTSSVYIVSLE